MKPDKKSKSEKTFYFILGLAIYFIVILFVAHWVWYIDRGTSYTFFDVTGHMFTSPFALSGLNMQTFLVLAFGVTLCAAFLLVKFVYNKQFYRGREEGSAGWFKDYSKYNQEYTDPNMYTHDKKISKNIIFTNDVCLSLDANKPGVNNNILVIGGSGTGKSRFFVKPNILQRHSSYVVTDPSGELLDSTGQYMKDSGYEVKVFNLVEMKYSNHYNPFAYIRDENSVNILVNTLITNTTPKGASKGDPFWEKSETNLLMAIIFYLYYTVIPEDQNFANVMSMLLMGQVSESKEDFKSPLDKMFDALEAIDPDNLAVRYYSIFKQGAGKTAKSILISCSTRLAPFNLTDVQYLTNTDDLDLATIGDKKTILYAVIPSADSTYNFLVSLMYSQLFESLYFHAENDTVNCPGKKLKNHVRFILDEFANIGTIPDFDKKLATMRKYKISCSIILQSLAQIKSMYEKDWETIVGNCASLLYLGSPEQTTNEYISKKLGKKTILGSSYTRSSGASSGVSTADAIKGRDLMTPDELSRLDNKECILFIYGLNPFFGLKYDYLKHPEYKKTGDADPNNIYDYRKSFTEIKISNKETDKEKEVLRLQTLIENNKKKKEKAEKDKAEKDKAESKTASELIENGEDATDVSVTGNHTVVTPEQIAELLMEKCGLTKEATEDFLSNAAAYDPYSEFDIEAEAWDNCITRAFAALENFA